ncbi:hypothetical protein EHE22_26295 (plasmid) [Ochrobactrum pseudogrignonense]|uniref:Uncharacterized protein n=1 Tax=Brucella pseudogrignonensis TaxID=419475 RepID=A0A7Y3WYT3_9HYPH|nr:type IV secretion system DNA-binding domain-containing protein [Brucella pseudogrignonensis]NNV23875.1 hypothetical protein [Brucella pseudogrignonensis]
MTVRQSGILQGILVVSQEAIELANRLVPQAANRFFSDSARAVLAVCIIKLMATNPGKWTWADLLEETRKDNETLLATALKVQPWYKSLP